MRTAIYLFAAFAALATLPPAAATSVLAGTAAILIEATPFLCAALLLARLLGHPELVAYAGCGCGHGPSARSIPAAVATGLLFGPAIAIARVLAASLVARRLERHACTGATAGRGVLAELRALVPVALVAATVAQYAPLDVLRHAPAVLQVLAGALLGALAPCALGSVALAGSLHAHAPPAAFGYLAIAGIADLRVLLPRPPVTQKSHDPAAYGLLAASLTIVALRHGDALVHPRFWPWLALAALSVLWLALRHRLESGATLRVAPAIALAGALITAPTPTYRATETTLAQAFPGERVSFAGQLTRHGATCALVRYAITCCRADATPVAVRLAHAVKFAASTWLRADGRIARQGDTLVLAPATLQAIAAPGDPFIYR